MRMVMVVVLMTGVAAAKKPAMPHGAEGAVDIVLIGKQANADKRRRCREEVYKFGGKLDKAAPVKGFIDVEPGKNFFKIVSATRGTVHEERLPGHWGVNDLCRDALAKLQKALGEEGGVAGPAATGDPKEMLDKGTQAMEKGEFAEAVRYFNGAYKQTNDPKLFKFIGRAHLARGKAASSIADLKTGREFLYKARDVAKEDVEADIKIANEEVGKLAK